MLPDAAPTPTIRPLKELSAVTLKDPLTTGTGVGTRLGEPPHEALTSVLFRIEKDIWSSCTHPVMPPQSPLKSNEDGGR